MHVWNKFSEQIESRNGSVDFPSASELLPHHTTTVIRLPEHISKRLHDCLITICPSDYHYPAKDMHLTLINLDELLSAQGVIHWESLASHISEQVSKLPQLEFQVSGINVFPTTIFAEIYDKTGLLEAYRQAIIRGVSSYLSVEVEPGNYHALVPGITFTNVVRFKNIPDPSLIEQLEPIRKNDFGAFRPEAFEIVETNKLLSSTGTVVHTRILC